MGVVPIGEATQRVARASLAAWPPLSIDGPDPDPEVVDRWDRLTEALLTRDAMLMTPRGATGLTRPDTMFSGLLSAKGALLSAKGACVSEVETTPRVRKGHTARTTCTYVLRASQRRC